MKIANTKEARKWFHEIMKPHLTKAIKDSKLYDAAILDDGTIILTTDKGSYFNIKLAPGQE